MSLAAITRSRATRHWIGALAVLVLSLRAAIPVGFMLGQVQGQLSVILCPAAGPTLAHDGTSADVPLHAEHHHVGAAGPAGHLDGHAAHHLTAAASCPFAPASGAMLLAQSLKIPDPYFVALRPAPAPVVVSNPAAPPPRHSAPRGPPALA